ncbi:MAG TPA: family 20 glycosylhydrolase [Bacteroidales bacterium]|nr:family 20 glycosylhydrolase [Bacteroidales bacterium]
MKRLIFGLLLITGVAAMGQTTKVNIIPQPASVQVLTGSWTLNQGASVGYNKDEAKPVADALVTYLGTPTGLKFAGKKGTGNSIQLNLNDKEDAKLGSEGYTLASSAKGVVITANKPAGLYYGIQTLLQLFPKEIESKKAVKGQWTIPAVLITDSPRFGWRGLMLDVSRNFFTKDEVKAYIDQMARFKFNTLHWHLTDDNGWRIEIKSLPRLTEVGAWRAERHGHFGDRADVKPDEPSTVGGFYTQDDIREIIKYAADRYVTIVPEIDVPGHSMAAIAAYPELSTKKDPNTRVNPGTNFAEWYGDGKFRMLIENTLNPSDEKVYEFLDKVFTEVAQLFPNPYIHVGGDECYKGFWEEDAGCQALMKAQNMTDVEQLQGYFVNRLEKILNAKGKKLLGWDEILEGGISPGATVMSWRGVEGGIKAAKMGHDVVMTPTTFCYIDYTQGDVTVDPPIYATLRLQKSYSFEPVPEGVDAKYILGGQGNLWTEQVETLRYAQYMTWPRGWALIEDFWTPAQNKNWSNFVERVENQFTRSDIAEINYSKAMYDAIVNATIKDGKMWIDMASEVPGVDIFYSIDGSMPDQYSPKYTAPFALPEGPITLRVVTYRNGQEIGHLITLTPELLKQRAGLSD